MPSSPNYGFNRDPQFSLNHISDYLATSNAPQRTKVIRAAKFPKKLEVAAYQQVRKHLRDALTKEGFAKSDLDDLIERLEAKARRETGYTRDEALRCASAVRAFQQTFNSKSFARYELSPSPKSVVRDIEGVKLNVSLDAAVTAYGDDTANSGGVVLKYASSASP